MAIELIIQDDLMNAVQDILDMGNAETSFSIEEILSVVFKFYGTVTKAVEHCVITPEEATHMHQWLVTMFELNY